eukprot:3375116-Heterocapsa_arctica.AAC.1
MHVVVSVVRCLAALRTTLRKHQDSLLPNAMQDLPSDCVMARCACRTSALIDKQHKRSPCANDMDCGVVAPA